jgi:hypothetical protein
MTFNSLCLILEVLPFPHVLINILLSDNKQNYTWPFHIMFKICFKGRFFYKISE